MTKSPCIGICQLDRKKQTCTGCGRTIDEIASWPHFTEEQKREIAGRLGRPQGLAAK